MWKIHELSLFCLTACLLYISVRSDDSKDNEASKRVPGWGKRSASGDIGYMDTVLSDLSRIELGKTGSELETEIEKRRPGWGKRSYAGYEYDLEKRTPGWGKRTPGWGKRTVETAGEYSSADDMVKRRPGWGKRNMYDSNIVIKRTPGWGKRAPGWGKRDGGDTKCKDIVDNIRSIQLQFAQAEDKFMKSCNAESLYDDMTDIYESE